jgi:putative nucleotidyltransferase with HDIG domain
MVDATVLVTAAAAIVASLSVPLLVRVHGRERAVAEHHEAEREAALLSAERAHLAARAASSLAAQAQAQAALSDAEAQLAVSRLHAVARGWAPLVGTMISLKDRYTARHSAAVALLARVLAEELGWSPEEQALAHLAGLVHDVGKVGLPDALLRKPGRPTEEEWALIRAHPDWGADALAEMALFPSVVEGVRSHHERWDGSGYPKRLARERIPPLGRLVAIADSYEAMITKRPFRQAKGDEAARAELEREAGRLYDPDMVRAFLAALTRLGWGEDPARIVDFADEWARANEGLLDDPDFGGSGVREPRRPRPKRPSGAIRLQLP